MSCKEDNEFFEVFNDEMKNWILPRRENRKPRNEDGINYYPQVDHKLIGLALSGGGIRSATYALGVLQRMAKAGILKFVDVLSTASGGGYLGASWSSLTANSKPDPAKADLAAKSEFGSTEDDFPFKFIDDEGEGGRKLFDRESDAVRHLRAHGYWLAPHLGLFDVWTWVAIFRYLLSTAINLLLIPIPWVLFIMMLVLLIPGGFWNRTNPLESPIALYMWVGPAVFFLIFLLFVWCQPKPSPLGAEIKHGLYRFQQTVLIIAIVLVLADIFILGIRGFYLLQLNILAPWIISVGGSGAALIAAVKAIYNFFTNEVQGGVTFDITQGFGKKVLSFAVGIIGYVALAVLLVVGYVALDRYFFLPDRAVPGFLPGTLSIYWGLLIGAFAVAIIMLFVPVRGFLNNLSLQSLYRRGLHKAYILKSNHPGEGVIPREKDFSLIDLKKEGENPPDMPYHLIVTAVNTSGDTDLKRLGRRSDGFVFAHLNSGSRITCYGETSKVYADMSLNEAMAISGAAVSPNMGRVTTTSFSILLTLLNVRLGSWVRNPKYPERKIRSWPPVIWYWGKELFGTASANDKFIYLSDGGHFDNSAIYELLKRRCKYILAIDAGSNFDNLATVSRLARVDLGVQMDVNLDFIKPDTETELSQQPYVVAKLKYPPVQGDSPPTEGFLVWISTGMTKRQKPDVLKYKETDPDFPFHTTGDQFFDQIQFEAYRQLGHSAARTLLENAGLKKEGDDREKEKLDRPKLEKAFENLWKTAASWQ